MSVWVGEVNLQHLRPARVPPGFEAARLFVRRGRRPLGWVSLTRKAHAEEFAPHEIKAAIQQQLPVEIAHIAFELQCLQSPHGPPRPKPVSVVICTENQPEHLQRSLKSLAQVDNAPTEILVVESSPMNGRTRALAHEFSARYIAEPRSGIARARNRGIEEATGELIAFVDDSALVAPGWLQAVDGGFAEPQVMGVTGLVLPLELETAAQLQYQDAVLSLEMGYCPKLIDPTFLTPSELLGVDRFGSSGNMAFRRSLFDRIGKFDVALDTNPLAQGGSYLELLHRMLVMGNLLRYEPEAIVWQCYERDEPALKRRTFGQEAGRGAFLATCWRNKSVRRVCLLRHILRQTVATKRIAPVSPGQPRRPLLWCRLAGLVWGALVQSVSRRKPAALGCQPNGWVEPLARASNESVAESPAGSARR